MSVLEKGFLTLDRVPSPPPTAWTAQRSALVVDSLRVSGRLRLRVRGESMLPALWPGDVVEITRCSIEDVRPGEIVLALRGDRFFLHRFLGRSQPSGFLLRGDSMPRPDPQFPDEALLGRLVSLAGRRQRGKDIAELARPVLPLRPWSRLAGQLICYCAPARSLALRLHGRRKQDAPEVPTTQYAAGIEALDAGVW